MKTNNPSTVNTHKKSVAISTAIASIITFGVTTNANAVPDQPKAWEKCAGIAKTGMNDCGALDGSHGCAGMAKADNLDSEWVYVPQGQCARITGGTVKKVKPAKS